MPQSAMPQTRPALALLALLLLTGCSAVVTDAEAPGAYKAQADWGISTLILSPDHTFDQTVRLNTGQTKHITGGWKLQRSSGEPVHTTINFNPYLNVTHDQQGAYALAAAFSIYHVPFGGINIAADPEYGIAHRK